MEPKADSNSNRLFKDASQEKAEEPPLPVVSFGRKASTEMVVEARIAASGFPTKLGGPSLARTTMGIIVHWSLESIL